MSPNAIWKIFGRVMKTSVGPVSGLTPTESAAGKITSPARIATHVSIVTTWKESFMMFTFSEK